MTRRLPGGAAPWVAMATAVVAAGIAAVLVRPLAPDLGPVPDPARWFTPRLLARIAAYQTPLRRVVVLATLLDVAVPVAIACTSRGRRWVDRATAWIGDRPSARAAAVAVVVIVIATCVRAPLDLWAHLHARAFGLTAQAVPGWIGDRSVQLLVTIVVAAIAVAVGYALAARWPRGWVLLVAPVALVMVTVATLAAPVVVEPLRFDLVRLPDGPVRRALEPVLAAAGRSDARLLVADASRRTTRQNAYVSGLWGTRRIVLYDTLLQRRPSQVALVVAHELAHDRDGDLGRGILAGAAGVWAAALAVDLVLRGLVRRRRLRAPAEPAGATAVVATLVVVLVLATPVSAWVSRRAEAAADLGSLRLTGAATTYCATQRGLVARNLSDPAPPTWLRLWSWTHPPAASRLLLAERIAPDLPC